MFLTSARENPWVGGQDTRLGAVFRGAVDRVRDRVPALFRGGVSLHVTEVADLVRAAGAGDAQALQALFAELYNELKRLARRQLAAVANPTINTTGLVHETYLKLIQPQSLRVNDDAHFFAIAARAMRQVLVDHARKRQTEKRGGDVSLLSICEDSGVDSFDAEQLIQLDLSLQRLQELEPALAALVELRFFAGLSVEQVAQLRGVTARTIVRDWRRARAFLLSSPDISD